MKQRFSKRTRLVSALLTLAMVFTFLPFSAFAATDSYGPVYITDANVPDKTFREYLLKQFDKDGNGVLTPAERYAVTEIDVENKYISNLSGLQFFPNLKVLNCSHNRLTKLDVSKNTVLQELVCWENQLTSLDVSQNTALQELACFENQLTSLDVSQNPALQKLNCGHNRLTSLDVSKNTELTYLKCNYNRLTELDVSKNTELTYLDCGYNRLTELDVSQNTKLTELYFVSNKITSLQADNCTNLTVIFTGSNKYKVEVYKKTRILDPDILPGNFDISRVRNLKGATQNADGTLTVQEGGGKVTYEYRCVGEIYKPFTLNVTETDDPNAGIVPPVTPPSGGDTPGGSTGGETGGGSTGGSTPGGPTGGETGGGSPGGGSTGGGFKVQRFVILWKSGFASLRKMVHPNSVNQVKSDDKILRSEVLQHVLSYLILYLGLVIASFMLISLDDMDFGTAVSAVSTCINNIGPGMNRVGPMENFSFLSDFSKMVLSADMLLGRLEIFPILVLLSPSVWRKSF